MNLSEDKRTERLGPEEELRISVPEEGVVTVKVRQTNP